MILTPFRIHAVMPAMNFLHLESLSALRRVLRDPHLFKEHISAIVDGAGVAMVGTFLTAEGGELRRLDLA